MEYKKMLFQEVIEEIKKIFPNSSCPSLQLLPDSIHLYAKQAGKDLVWKPNEWWEQFELDQLSDAEIIYLILGPYQLVSGEVIIVTDECFRKKEAYVVPTGQMLEFIEEVYPEIDNMQFFQPSDTILIFPNQSLLIILEHEGHVMRYKGT
jgi:hypothetical protein